MIDTKYCIYCQLLFCNSDENDVQKHYDRTDHYVYVDFEKKSIYCAFCQQDHDSIIILQTEHENLSENLFPDIRVNFWKPSITITPDPPIVF